MSRRYSNAPPHHRPPTRPGLTLIELMLAITLTVLVMGAMAAVTKGVQMSYAYTEGYGTVTQHARVVIDRIARNVKQATANESFPGFLVLADTEGTYTFPETLVIWRPSGAPSNPQGLPRYNELVIYAPAPENPNELVEFTTPSDTRQAPDASDVTAWTAAIRTLKRASSTQKVSLTTLLRTALTNSSTRGAVRFVSRLTPSDADWTNYTQGSSAWNQLAWPRGLQGSRWGMRQAWLRMELQFQPQPNLAVPGSSLSTAVFFGSATVEFALARRN